MSAKYLSDLEFHIADHCNMNCKACGHHSSLVTKPVFPDIKKFTCDFEQFHKFIDDITIIRIMGGEPLLNPEVNEYIKLTRRLYPLADLQVVTNAILLLKMPEEFFDTLQSNNVSLDISLYPPMLSKAASIVQFLQEKQIRFHMSQPIKKFQSMFSITKNNQALDSFLNCGYCATIYGGKTAVCTAPFTIKYFNRYFGKNFSENEGSFFQE